VVDAGFTPTWIRFEAVGRLTTRDGSPAFEVRGTEQVIPLVADEQFGDTAEGREVGWQAREHRRDDPEREGVGAG
ncbi:MAG: hypothetical protein M5R38_04805, partial [Candidatus Methylomirabilis sp.]|nr:hypothetical protein [Candidatus Methylomirabilis sp.]